MSLPIYYISVFIFLNIVIIYFIYRGSVYLKSPSPYKKIAIYGIGTTAWLIYLYIISRNEFLLNMSFPPRFLIFIFGPILIFFGWFFIKNSKTKVFDALPASFAVYYQSFRIIMELVIFSTFLQGIIPQSATFQGYNFEIVLATTAPLLGYILYRYPSIPKSLIIIWNVIGIVLLMIVVSILASSFYNPDLWGSSRKLVNDNFIRLPLLLLPAFMVPSAIFFHLYSIRQMVIQQRLSHKTN